MDRRRMWRSCVAGSLLCAGAYATDYTWTAGGSDDNWTNADNWDNAGYPGQYGNSDTVTIPGSASYPIFDAAEVTIASLTISAYSSGEDELIFESVSSGSRVLKITARDGLSLSGGSNTSIKLQQNSQLWLLGGGIATVAGEMTFAVGTGASAPRLVVGEGNTVSIEGGGTLLADTEAVVTGEVAAQDDTPETLVIADTVSVKGSFTFDTILFAHGPMYTSKNESARGTIRLTCHPKSGAGLISVDGGTAQDPSLFIVDCAFAGWGDLLVGPYGKLQVNRHHVMVHHPYSSEGNGAGDLKLKRGGKLGVTAGIYFEADHSTMLDCPDNS